MCQQRPIGRRGFLKGAAAVAVTPILGLGRARAAIPGLPGRFLVVINLIGGNDGLSTVVPTHLSAYAARRPNLRLLPGPDGLLPLAGGWHLHGNLPRIKSLWDAGELHIVQKVGYPGENLSHFTSQDIYSFGVRDVQGSGDGRGWLGRFADAHCSDPGEPLGVVAVGVGRRRDFEAGTTQPLVVDDPDDFRILPDPARAADHALRVAAVRSLPAGGASAQAHALVDRVQRETAGWRDPALYPASALGRNLRTVSRLLHAQQSFRTRIFYTGLGGFDTHAAQPATHAALLAELDGAIGAFAQDMAAKGRWRDCAIVVISEFGRRNAENGSAGTDHGHGNAFLVLGGAVRGGAITGTVLDSDIGDRLQLGYDYDFREIYADLVSNHLGLGAAPLFPEPFVRTGDITLV